MDFPTFVNTLVNSTREANGEPPLSPEEMGLGEVGMAFTSLAGAVVMVRPRDVDQKLGLFSLTGIEVEVHSREDSVGGVTIWLDAEEY